MSKVASKFIADVSVKIGRQGLVLKVPLDFGDYTGTEPDLSVLDVARERVTNEAKLSVANLADLKRAFKAYNKSKA